MRLTAIIPVLCCAAALVLSFLCLFAGSKKNFMEDYHIMTLNTSRIGYQVVNSALSGGNPLSDLFSDLTPDDIEDDVRNIATSVADDIAARLGVDDWYSVHILDYCEGQYIPIPLPNATVKSDDIHKNVTDCSKRTANFQFDPKEIIERKLNESGLGVTLDDLEWPDNIQRGIDALHAIQTAVFVMYCISIGLIAISFLAALPAIITSGRLAACLNVLVASLAFLAIGLASALVTAVCVKGSEIIDKYGKPIGLEAHKGSKFLGLTWAATALMLITLCLWVFETCIGHRRRREPTYVKHG